MTDKKDIKSQEIFKDMAAVATIANPLKPENVLMWWNATDGNLKLKQRPFADSGDKEYKKQTAKGSVKNPSAITTFQYQDMIWTFGICNDTEVEQGRIFALSPYLDPVVSAEGDAPQLSKDLTNKGSLTGCSSNDTAWLYFINSNDILEEFEYEKGSTQTKYNIVPRINSYLSAVYDTDAGDRYLVYQGSEALHIAGPEAKSTTMIPGSAEAKDGTPIATCYYNRRIFIYWITSADNINRHSMPTGGTFKGDPTTLTNQKKPSGFTQLSVTPNTTALNLYYLGLSGGSVKFIQYLDKGALKVA